MIISKHSALLLLFAAALSLFSSSAISQTMQTYKLDWFPVDDADCPAIAKEIGIRFKEATGLTVLGAGCERTFSWKQDLVIQYMAPAPARLISTHGEFAGTQGTYPDRESCESGLTEEKQLFTAKTSLPVVAAYCFPETSMTSENKYPYIARIDGFGMPAVRPFVFATSLYGRPDFKEPVLEQLLSDSLGQLELIEEPRLRADFTGSIPRVVVKYYSTRQRALTLDSIISYENATACQVQRDGIDRLLTEFGIVGAVSYCAKDLFSEVARHYYFGLSAGPHKVVRPPGTFSARAQCSAALPEIVANYQAVYPASVIKGFCSYERPEIWTNYTYVAKIIMTE